MEKIYTHFYNEYFSLKKEMKHVDGFYFMEHAPIFGSKTDEVQHHVSPYDFLHGWCDIFAFALYETFGYPIYCIKEKKQDKIAIHYYCKPQHPDGCVADVRGITNDDFLFLQEFEEWLENSSYTYKVNPQTIYIRIKNDYDKSIYKTALAIIHNNMNGYNSEKITERSESHV